MSAPRPPVCNTHEFEVTVQDIAPTYFIQDVNDHLIANDLPPVMGLADDQNGLDNESIWLDLTDAARDADRDAALDELERLGFAFFEAPNDDGENHLSTYGIPVDRLADLFPGDRILADHTDTYRVRTVYTVSDGGPWETKSRLTIAAVTRTDTGTDRLLVVDHTADDPTPTMYTQNNGVASGYAPLYECDDLHRHPRHDELDP